MFNPSAELLGAGLQVMAYGLVGVFTVLILFYVVTKSMVSVFTKLDEKRKARLENR
jgi:Na+-transporting methylmalonyl-CoA/oxaloacetate decarboxylase gamma subunit